MHSENNVSESGNFCYPPAETPFVEVSGRNVAALLNPRPVVLIGSYQQRANFATVAWVTPLSHEPALIAFALRPRSKTLQDVRDTGCFSINTLDASLLDVARFCGNHSGHTHDKGEHVAHYLALHQPYAGAGASPSASQKGASNKNIPAVGKRVPFVEGALSLLDCEVESIRSVGDHELVIGYVCKAQTRCAADENGLVFATDTLLCLQHDDFTIAKDDRGNTHPG